MVGFITAGATRYGYVLHRSASGGPAPAGSVAPGPSWRPRVKTACLDCELGPVGRPAGWDRREKESNQKNRLLSRITRAGALAPNARVRVPWAHQLMHKEAKRYSLKAIFRAQMLWNPAGK